MNHPSQYPGGYKPEHEWIVLVLCGCAVAGAILIVAASMRVF